MRPVAALSLFLVTCCFRLAHSQDCATGWSGSVALGACYYLTVVTDGTVGATYNWQDASSFCTSLRSGAFLAEIKTQEQQDYVRAALVGLGPDHVWIGGNDITTEGVFEWGLNTGDTFSYTAWAPTEPNGGDNGEDEDCVTLWDYVSYSWNDVPCGMLYESLCEYTPDGVTAAPATTV